MHIEPISQRLFPVPAPVYGLFAIQNHAHFYNSRYCRLTNIIVQLESIERFYVGVLNISNKPWTFPVHTRVGIVNTTLSVIYQYANNSDDGDAQ